MSFDDEGLRLLESLTDEEIRLAALIFARQRGDLVPIEIVMHPDYFDRILAAEAMFDRLYQREDLDRSQSHTTSHNLPVSKSLDVDPHDPLIILLRSDGAKIPMPLSKWNEADREAAWR